MLIEFGKPQVQNMIFVHAQSENALVQLKHTCTKAYQNILSLHKRFYSQLQKYQCDKESLFKKVICLSSAYETVLLELSAGCQGANLSEVGKLSIKMHLQSMEIIKWLIKNLGQFAVAQQYQPDKYLNAYKQRLQQIQNQQKNNPNYYFRVKQNSVFAAEGINKQIVKICEQLNFNKRNQQMEIRKILNNKDQILKLQASESEQILFQAVEIISHHSQVFSKLTKNNQQKFIDNYKNLNVKPYSKLKNEIDEAMKGKVNKTMKKLSNTLSKYFKTKNAKNLAQIQSKKIEFGVQANLNKQFEDKFIREDKKKTEKIKQLTKDANFHKTRAQKLEQLVRQKTNYFQQKLVKARFQRNKKSESQIKKSISRLTSLNKISQGQHNKIQSKQIIQNKSRKAVQFNFNLNDDNKDLKSIKKGNLKKRVQQVIYQKSLMRIQFDIQNQFQTSSDNSKRSIKIQPNLILCEKTINFWFDPKFLNIQKLEQRKLHLSLFSGIYDFEINTPQPRNSTRNRSMLTITNLKGAGYQKNQRQTQRKSVLFSKTHQHEPNRSSFSNSKFFPIQRRTKKQLTEQLQYCSNDENQAETETPQNNLLYITNKFQSPFFLSNKIVEILQGSQKQFTNESNQVAKVVAAVAQQQKQQNKDKQKINGQQKDKQTQNNILKRVQKQKYKVKNNFQLINLDGQGSISKKRFNAMMSQFKKKRLYRQGLPGQRKKNYQTQEHNESQIKFETSWLVQVYFGEQNAMQAQIQYGVSVSTFVNDRKNISGSNSLKFQTNLKNQNFIDQFSKKILKSLLSHRRKQPKLYQELHSVIKFPLSFIKGVKINKQQIKQQLTLNQIKNFVRYITNLHYNCPQKPCNHVQQFLTRMNIKYD